MADVLWVVQENLGGGQDYARLLAAFKSLGLDYQPVRIVPFADDVPIVEWDGPIIAYGSTRFAINVHSAEKWQPGVFFDEQEFTMGAYIQNYGSHVLNSDADLISIKEFTQQDYTEDSQVFVRPQRDLKEFEARVTDVGSLNVWFAKICEGEFELNPETPIVVAAPVHIDIEWRIFIVDGQSCAGSRYRTNGNLDVLGDVPKEVTNFAEQMASIWSPAKVFAIDIGLADTELKVIEINCFNSSGFYASDVEQIVENVTELVA